MADAVEILFQREDIRRRVQDLGRQISADYAGRNLVLVSVLKGGTMFLADLFREIEVPLRVEFMSISRYAGESDSSGVVRILKDLDQDVLDEHVLIVEDIIDTGLTLSYLLAVLGERRPASLEVCTLLDKSVRRIAPLEIRYRGFDCPDVFVVGYGLDWEERFRNLPCIVSASTAALRENPEILEPYLDEVGAAPPDGGW